MKTVRIPRLILAGTGSGCGKTTVTAGLLRALADTGLAVQPFKAGPDYIDPMFHQAACRRASANLDSWLLEPDRLRALFCRRMQATGAGLAVIEGVMGLYDGIGDTGGGSTAELATVLNAPIVLLVDGRGLALSVCALIQGYQHFQAETGRRIAGVILNRLDAGSATYLGRLTEKHCGIPVLGSLPVLPDCHLESRHLGLVPAGEDPDLEPKLRQLAEQVQTSIDLAALRKLAEEAADLPAMPDEQAASPITGTPVSPTGPAGSGARLGVALDAAFNFYYDDNFDLLRRLGAELVFFSPLADACLPADIDGLYLGGGYPEMFAGRLTANAGLRRQIRELVLAGLPTVAECGGFLYLSQTLQDRASQDQAMCAVLPTRCRMTDRLQRFGYQTLTLSRDGLLGQAGDQIRAHEFHYSTTDDYGQDCLAAKPDGRTSQAVFHSPTAWIGYPHLHFGSQPAMAANWLQACRIWRDNRRAASDARPTVANPPTGGTSR